MPPYQDENDRRSASLLNVVLAGTETDRRSASLLNVVLAGTETDRRSASLLNVVLAGTETDRRSASLLNVVLVVGGRLGRGVVVRRAGVRTVGDARRPVSAGDPLSRSVVLWLLWTAGRAVVLSASG